MSKLKYIATQISDGINIIKGIRITTYKKLVGTVDIVSISELEDETIELYCKDSTWKSTTVILPRDAFDKLVEAINNKTSVDPSSTGEIK